MAGLIETRREGPIVIWTLNRPERLNALPDLEDEPEFPARRPRGFDIGRQVVKPPDGALGGLSG